MTTDPGDLVLDPTCGSGTTAFVAEQWGRRWITIDTSRVALALARTRLMAARYAWYLLADSREGRAREAELSQRAPADTPIHHDLRQGFVYERVPHIMLKSIANNPLIDDIWEKWQAVLEPLRTELNRLKATKWEEWEVPRKALDLWSENDAKIWAVAYSDQQPLSKRQEALKALNHNLRRAFTLDTLPPEPGDPWAENVTAAHTRWWEARIARQKEIDASIAARADVEYLYDKPYVDNCARPRRGAVHRREPFTASRDAGKRTRADRRHRRRRGPALARRCRSRGTGFRSNRHRLPQGRRRQTAGQGRPHHFREPGAVAGQFHRRERNLHRRRERPRTPRRDPDRSGIWHRRSAGPCRRRARGRGRPLRRADRLRLQFRRPLYELGNLGSLKILKARINPDMHMSEELKNTGRGNMFVVFGEPDVEILDDGGPEIRVKVNGVDVFDPNTGDIRSNDTAGIAAWFIDTDYNEESFFVRHAYFLGANDPYKSLKTALQTEIDEDAWATLYSDTSRPFERPESGRIAIKVINHFGDEVMKVFRV